MEQENKNEQQSQNFDNVLMESDHKKENFFKKLVNKFKSLSTPKKCLWIVLVNLIAIGLAYPDPNTVTTTTETTSTPSSETAPATTEEVTQTAPVTTTPEVVAQPLANVIGLQYGESVTIDSSNAGAGLVSFGSFTIQKGDYDPNQEMSEVTFIEGFGQEYVLLKENDVVTCNSTLCSIKPAPSKVGFEGTNRFA